jgi:hypothetical protein
MKRPIIVALGFVAVLAAAQACAQVTFYSQEGFRGRSFVASGLGRQSRRPPASTIAHRRRSSTMGSGRSAKTRYLAAAVSSLKPGQYPSLGAMGLSNAVSSGVACRDGTNYAYAPSPPPPPPPPYAYYPHHGEPASISANVVAVRASCRTARAALLGRAAAGQHRRRSQRAGRHHRRGSSAACTRAPGRCSGRGKRRRHRCGRRRGRGRGVPTSNRGSGQVVTQNVQRLRCRSGIRAAELLGTWTYQFRGVTHRAQLAFAPGPTITVNGRGEPRV